MVFPVDLAVSDEIAKTLISCIVMLPSPLKELLFEQGRGTDYGLETMDMIGRRC